MAMKMCKRVLVVDEEPHWLGFTSEALEKKGFDVDACSGYDDLWSRLAKRPDIVVLGFASIGDAELRAIDTVLQQLGQRHVLVFSTALPIGTVRAVLRLGVSDVAGKRFDPEEVLELVEDECEERQVSSYQEVKSKGPANG